MPNKDYLSIVKELIDPCFSLLDVGCGTGDRCFTVTGFIVGLEIHRPYLENRENRQPHIIPLNADAMKMDQLFMPKTFSAVLFMDTLEHFSKKDGLHLLKVAEEIATDKVVVFTPRGFFPQRNYDYYNMQGERFQEHRSGWEPEDFLERGYYVLVLKGLHDAQNPSFVRSFGADHPPVDALLAYKMIRET
ncbi:hypothetical protein SD71_18220 [Cohnella kolymensis]|uniref:Methyltransferase type 11 domain-containing protein n=1 Tax=Cohnella kolymensis TaxID=1590652 RepID=A0ABR5A1A9_9BACL|nr:hypothetical protein SD71_18220 [Cohnella kolymensis]